MLVVHTFAIYSRENGQPVGQGLICPAARYILVKWMVYARAERRTPVATEWTAIDCELEATLPSATLSASGPIAAVLSGDRAPVVSITYLDRQSLTVASDTILDELEKRLLSIQDGWLPLPEGAFVYDIHGRVLTLKPIGSPSDQQRVLAYQTIAKDARVPLGALVLLDARLTNAPPNVRDLDRRTRALVAGLGTKLGERCAVIVPAHLLAEARHIAESADSFGFKLALFTSEDEAREWLVKSGPGPA